MTEITDDIERILLNYLDGTCSGEELLYLRNWISKSDENKEELKRYKTIYLTGSLLKDSDDYDANKAWQNLQSKYSFRQVKSFTLPVINSMFFKIAAIIIVVLVTGIISYRFLYNKSPQNLLSEYNVPRGSRSHIFLPDGTSVWLNAQSTLKYNQSFGQNQREVILEGEAYFEVVRNENIPFVVKASDATVKVLGTSFNVKAYPEENFIETTVVHGKVQVWSPQIDSNGNITLVANQKVKIIRETQEQENSSDVAESKDTTQNVTLKLSPIIAENVDFSPNVHSQVYTSWKDSQWIIERESLKELAIKIERRYNVQIRFDDPELEGLIFSGKLKDESLEQVLQAISAAAPIDFSINRKNIVLYHNHKFRK